MSGLCIVGAGLSGLIAAHAWPGAPVYERDNEPTEHHKALLRFRSGSVAALTGIEFQKVTVRKAIYADGFRAPTISYANAYSAKVIGRVTNDRSIWNLEPVERWIAPDDFYMQLVTNVGARIHWGTAFDIADAVTHAENRIISTIPLPATMAALGEEFGGGEFRSAPITVRRYRVRDCDVYQTVYFPEPDLPIYRASITGSTLIAESVGEPLRIEAEAARLERVFGITGLTTPIESARQRYGKIAPIDAAARRALLYRLTSRYHVYSLGRFATWRNVLLDDLVHDIAVIKKLLIGDNYGTRLVATG